MQDEVSENESVDEAKPEEATVIEDLKVGDIVEGEVTNITKFGAFIKLNDKFEGLCHISEIANEFVSDIGEFINVGDVIPVKVLNTTKKDKLELSVKKAKAKEAPAMFLKKKTKDTGFEDKLTGFLKKSEEKQIDIRRNLKSKQGITKKRR